MSQENTPSERKIHRIDALRRKMIEAGLSHEASGIAAGLAADYAMDAYCDGYSKGYNDGHEAGRKRENGSKTQAKEELAALKAALIELLPMAEQHYHHTNEGGPALRTATIALEKADCLDREHNL